MTGTGKARKREQAIAALLEHPTITAAESAVGIGQKMLRRGLTEPKFQAADGHIGRGSPSTDARRPGSPRHQV